MVAGSHPESGLAKSVWGDADFDAMGWHDVAVHGICVQRGGNDDALPRLLLDIDYIVRWVHPVAPATHFSFWISPSTLVFEDVWDLQGNLDFKEVTLSLDIDHIRRAEAVDGHSAPQWHLEGHYFDLSFRATGFRQYARQEPRHSQRLALTADERAGLSFAETAFD